MPDPETRISGGIRARLARVRDQWPGLSLAPIELPDPHDAVRVTLTSDAANTIDVTGNLVCAAMRPLTFAMGQVHVDLEPGAALTLTFEGRRTSRTLGSMGVRVAKTVALDGLVLILLEPRLNVTFHGDRIRRALDWIVRHAGSWRAGPRQTQDVDARELESCFLFYACPRPVSIVSVRDGAHANVFPMDLMGSVTGDRYLLCLRSTNVSIGAIAASQRVAIGSAPFAETSAIYAKGRYHREVTPPLANPRYSPRWLLPLPASVDRVRELNVEHSFTHGSHTIFIARALDPPTPVNGVLHHVFRPLADLVRGELT